MKIRLKQDDFTVVSYDLCIGEKTLDFIGEEPFHLPYTKIKDFVISQDSRGKLYFTMTAVSKLYEGAICDMPDIEGFAVALKGKIGGIINLEIRKG